MSWLDRRQSHANSRKIPPNKCLHDLVSTTVELLQEKSSATGEDHEISDGRVLGDRAPEWMRTPSVSVLFVVTLGVLMVTLFARRPLWPTDLWDHVNYGAWILLHQRVPTIEPLMALSDGVPMVNTAWLAQVVLASVMDAQGFAGLQFVYGLLVILPLAIIAWAGVRRSSSIVTGFATLLSLLVLNWQQFLIIRPQLTGVLFFTVLVTWLLTQSRPGRTAFWSLPLMFAIWANSHGSFSLGLVALAICAFSHAVSVWLRTRRVKAALISCRSVRLFLICQLCAAAALLNPNGLAVYVEVLRVGSHPNIDSMFEWDPLTLRMRQGQVTALLAVGLILLLRRSPRRLRVDETLLLGFTGGMTLWSARMINWLAPVMALTIAAHGTAAWRLWRGTRRNHAPGHRSGLWTLVNVGLCLVFFALTTLGVQLIHGRSVEIDRALSTQTPVSAVEFLKTLETVPRGITFCSAEWSGFIRRFGPRDVHPMVNLHVHVIPEEVWSHYMHIIAGSSDWDGLMKQYGVNLALTDQTRHERLIREIRESAEWKQLYVDSGTVIFERLKPI